MMLMYSTYHTCNSLKIALVSERNGFLDFLFNIEDVGHSLSVSLSLTYTVPAYHTWQPAGLITIFLLHPGDVQLLPV